MMSEDDVAECVNLAEVEELARRKLPASTWGYYAGGANGEATLRDNEAAFGRYRLLPRMLASPLSLAAPGHRLYDKPGPL